MCRKTGEPKWIVLPQFFFSFFSVDNDDDDDFLSII